MDSQESWSERMKKFIFLYLLIFSLVLLGCTKPTLPTEEDVVTEPVETIIPTEPVETEEPTVVPPVPTPEPVYQLEIHLDDVIYLIDSTDLSTMTEQTVEVEDHYGIRTSWVGYRLTEILNDFTYNGLSVSNLISTEHYAITISNLYLLIGTIIDEVPVYHEYDEYLIARINNRSMESLVVNPSRIDLRVFDPAQAIYYIEYRSVSGRYDHHTSLRAMQGIINRHQPKLLTISTGNPYFKHSDQTWLDHLESLGYDLIELNSLEEVIFTFKDHFNGIITFKDRFKSYNGWISAESDFALMMASIHDYAPIPSGLENSIASLTGLPIITSFIVNEKTVLGNISTYLDQNKITEAYAIYEHVFDHFKEAFNSQAYMSLTSEVMDYAASQRMMFFDLKATQSTRDNLLSIRINQYFDQKNDYFNVYGWVDHESSALDFISSYGGIIDVVGNGNLSLLSRLDIDTETFVQKAKYQSTYQVNKKFVTFFASESDTIKVGVAFQHGAWLDPNRGKVPINWGLIADMSEEFPFVYDYFMKTATEMDYFYSGGGSAIGFVDIDSQMSLTSRNAIADANAYFLGKADQHIIDMYNDKYTSTDLFEKTVLGSYLFRSQVEGAFARIHDSNTAIRVETWNNTPVYNRWTNFYPRRGATSEVNLLNMDIINSKHVVQSLVSDYWFIETELSTSLNTIGFELFRQTNGDGYQLILSNGKITLLRTVSGNETILQELNYHTTSRKVKLSIDHSSLIDPYPRIKLYINDLKIIDVFDKAFVHTSGGFGLFSDDSISTTFTKLTGTKYSMAESIYNRIIQDSNRFILAYYGFVGTDEYGNAQYRTEPGIGGVISLSPTDFYNIKLMLEKNYPDVYEIVHANEFLEYAKTYQAYYGNLR